MNSLYKRAFGALLIMYLATLIWMLLDWKDGFGALPWWGMILELMWGAVLIIWCARMYRLFGRRSKP